jgi:hypothetical protein
MEIKNRFTGAVIYSGEAATLMDLVAKAVKSGANLYGANMSGANMSRANLYGADLSGANLSRANMSGANLYGADLYGAILYGANLSRANMSGANLSRANMSGANLYGADLSGADLYGADLSGANLYGADLSRANMSGANMSRANLSRANMSGANLSGAKGIVAEWFTPLLMLLDQPGAIRAYKMVTASGDSPMCVTSGYKPIHYEVGKDYEVSDACTDVTIQCAAGISLATLDWILLNYSEGHRVFVAEFEAKDIAAIPTATDGKFRVKRCKIVAEKDISALVQKEQP